MEYNSKIDAEMWASGKLNADFEEQHGYCIISLQQEVIEYVLSLPEEEAGEHDILRYCRSSTPLIILNPSNGLAVHLPHPSQEQVQTYIKYLSDSGKDTQDLATDPQDWMLFQSKVYQEGWFRWILVKFGLGASRY